MRASNREESGGGGPARVGAPVLSLRDAAFGYGERTIVNGLTLQADRGEVIAVLGPNGAGKSTFAKGLLGLSDHLGGRAQVLGENLDELTQRHLIGYVPQRFTLSSTVPASVREIVAVGRLHFLPWHGRLSRHDKACIADALDFVQMGDRAADDVEALSGGQQRRVLIARALASEPDILIMDEPTAGVDEANQRILADCMVRLAQRGKTIIVITHELPNLWHAVTRALIISHGRLTYDGDPDRIPSDLHGHGAAVGAATSGGQHAVPSPPSGGLRAVSAPSGGQRVVPSPPSAPQPAVPSYAGDPSYAAESSPPSAPTVIVPPPTRRGTDRRAASAHPGYAHPQAPAAYGRPGYAAAASGAIPVAASAHDNGHRGYDQGDTGHGWTRIAHHPSYAAYGTDSLPVTPVGPAVGNVGGWGYPTPLPPPGYGQAPPVAMPTYYAVQHEHEQQFGHRAPLDEFPRPPRQPDYS